MIVAYILVWTALSASPVPPMADMASCERVRAALASAGAGDSKTRCVQVTLPSPSREAYYNLPNKIQ